MKKAVKIPLLLLLVSAVVASDLWLTHNNFIANSDIFIQNDFEITQHDHPEKPWNKVFFGNSVVISSYMENKSKSGYINCGLDYGVVTDLDAMIKNKYIDIGSDLVIGLNYLTLYDDFDTNPTYIWHKKWYQSYAYFERDRFYPLITDTFTKVINGEEWRPMTYKKQEKAIYHGRVSDAALTDKFEEYQKEFFNQPIEKYEKNMKALQNVIDYCSENDIRLRVVWMPWNPMFTQPDLVQEVHKRTQEILDKNNIETLDLEDEFSSENFYDTGHLNYDVGSEKFTELIDSWL